jgi:hypothetical protein
MRSLSKDVTKQGQGMLCCYVDERMSDLTSILFEDEVELQPETETLAFAPGLLVPLKISDERTNRHGPFVCKAQESVEHTRSNGTVAKNRVHCTDLLSCIILFSSILMQEADSVRQVCSNGADVSEFPKETQP